MKEIIRYTVALLLICMVAAGLLSSVNKVTRPKIESQIKKQTKDSLKIVMPEASQFEKNIIGETVYYEAYGDSNNLLGYCFKVNASGYSSIIETMVGLQLNGVITDIYILSQNETPGLGSKIVEVAQDKTIWDALGRKSQVASLKKRPWFQEQFHDKTLEQLEDVETITGATISSEAVIESVRKGALKLLEEIKNARE